MILQRIRHHSKAFIDVAERFNSVIEKRAGIDIPGAEPRIRISTNEQAKTLFGITIFCPTNQAIEMEQQITEEFMDYYYQNHTPKP